jgi:hypothetical protein
MAENMPRTIDDFINWSKFHADLWQQDPASAGLTPEQAAQFAALAADLIAANAAAEHAREASKSATLALNTALAATRKVGGVLISTIKNHARATDDRDVLARGGVSPVAPQSTLPPPTPPMTMSSSINSDGSLTLSWTARQPAGVTDVVYLVHRRLGGTGEFRFLGVEGARKTFTDTTIPIGTSTVEYLITPKRGGTTGQSGAIYMVQFGSVGGAGRSAGAPGVMKMAA